MQGFCYYYTCKFRAGNFCFWKPKYSKLRVNLHWNNILNGDKANDDEAKNYLFLRLENVVLKLCKSIVLCKILDFKKFINIIV